MDEDKAPPVAVYEELVAHVVGERDDPAVLHRLLSDEKTRLAYHELEALWKLTGTLGSTRASGSELPRRKGPSRS